jgi:hypothetical protein
MVVNGGRPFSATILMSLLLLILALPHLSGTHAMRRAGGKNNNVAPELLPLPDSNKLSVLQKAYLDVYSILSEENSCSNFFGGSRSIAALNRLLQQLRSSCLEHRIAIRMSGSFTFYQDETSNLRYRLFDKVEVNSAGPFFKSSTPRGPTIPFVGPFPPNTREARATILLHELGHLIESPGNGWLLVNDGNDSAKSEENTERVLKVCRDQIGSLRQFTFETELAQAQSDARQSQP